MSSKEKDTLHKLKQFFRINKGATGLRNRSDFSLTLELEHELSSETPIQQRSRAIREISEEISSSPIESVTIEKLWVCTRDLLDPRQPKDNRHLVLGFLKTIVHSQYAQLGILRGHFFRVIQNHNIEEDAQPRFELLETLTFNGKDIIHFEAEIGTFLLEWLPGLCTAGLTEPALAMMVKLIKFNAAHLDQCIIAEIVRNACYLCCVKQSVLGALDVLDTVVCYAIFPQETLRYFICTLCRTVNDESYCITSWKIMRNLLGKQLGHSALYALCRILQDPSSHIDGELLRGAVFYINMALWGNSKVSSLKCSPCSVLPSFLHALLSEHCAVIYEVTLSIQRLINKLGRTLSEPAWDLVLDIMNSIALHIIKSQSQFSLIKTHFHETITTIEKLVTKKEFVGSLPKLYDLIEMCSLDRPDQSVLQLMDYRSESLHPTHPLWQPALLSLLDKFFRQETRSEIRLHSLEILGKVINDNKSACEDELLETIVVPILANLHAESDANIRSHGAKLLVDLCHSCESKSCLEILDILEKVLNRPFETFITDGVSRSEMETPDLRTVTNGLIRIFTKKIYLLPSTHAIRVFSILVNHIERHYEKPAILAKSNFTRYRIFDCFLKTRANGYYHVGYPDPSKVDEIKYSVFLSIKKNNESISRSLGSPVASATHGNLNVTSISIEPACKAIITSLRQEKDWHILQLILQELPQLLQNRALVLSRPTNNIDLLGSTLCAMLTDDSMGLPHTLVNAPTKFSLSDFHAHILPCLSALAPYHQSIEPMLQQRLIRCLVKYGFVTRCARQCVTALTVVTLEMQEAMVKLLPEVLLDLSKMSATQMIAVPILEFLSTLTRLPKVFVNFVGDQYMSIFAILLPYTNPFRYNHYIVSLAHHVIAAWFLKCRLPFRRDFVKFITTGLKSNCIAPFEEGRMLMKPEFGTLNEDSSNRKRSSSLTEQGSRRRDRPAIARPIGDLRPSMNEALLSFHVELTETCIDLMARHTFSPCSAFPKRLPSADWLLSQGQSTTWLLGHKLITVTTSGCSQSPLRNGLCDRCWTSCRANTTSTVLDRPHSPEHQETGRSSRRESDLSKSLKPELLSDNKDIESSVRRELDFQSTYGKHSAVDDQTKVHDKLKPVRKEELSKPEQNFCACWCQGWAEVYVRRPTGDTSWVMRIQNQIQYDTPNSEFPLHDITSVFFPSNEIGVKKEPIDLAPPTSAAASADSESDNETSQQPTSTTAYNSNSVACYQGDAKLSSIKQSSVPIQIPGSPSRQLSNSSEDQDISFDEADDRLRNPVRRVNSSPEMSSSYKKPYLMVRDKIGDSGALSSHQDSISGEEEVMVKKNNTKCFTKDRGCEAIPEEMSGGTPPSHPALMTLHSDPGYNEDKNENMKPIALSNTVPCIPVIASSTLQVVDSLKRSSELQRLHSLDSGHNINKCSIPMSTGNNMQLIKKPPHSPIVPLSPKVPSRDQQNTDNIHKFSLNVSLDNNDGDAPRERSKTISVMSPVRNTRENLKWSGAFRTKESAPRSGINPSFVFLQLYHTAQLGQITEKPILVSSQYQKAISIIDFIPPFETHKIGVLYVGPGQCNNETEILKNRYGSVRYATFLQSLGTLVSLQEASKHSLFIDLERNGKDGKFAYVWQDDIMQVTFHVATLMPNKETDPLCNEKKKHIGNDYVSIIYNESGEEYNMQTIKGQFNYACVIVQPLEMGTNCVTVRAREEVADHIGHSEPKVVSDNNAAILARQLALHSNLASMISRSLNTKGNCPFASNWLERLRKIKNLRNKLLQTPDSLGSHSSINTSNTASSNSSQSIPDFTEYT